MLEYRVLTKERLPINILKLYQMDLLNTPCVCMLKLMSVKKLCRVYADKDQGGHNSTRILQAGVGEGGHPGFQHGL